METPPNPIYTKEMVDLLMRVKKHLLSHQQVSIRLSDPLLFDKLVRMHVKDDALLQGMLQYLMALAGPEWSQLYASGDAGRAGRSAEQGARGFFRRGAAFLSGHGEYAPPPAPDSGPALPTSERKPVRYYRGQPIYDDGD